MAHFLLIQEQAAAAAAAPQVQASKQLNGALHSLSQKAVAQTKRQRRRKQQRQHHLLDEPPLQQPDFQPQQASLPPPPQTQQQGQQEQGMPREVVSLASLCGWHLGKRIDKSCQLANEAWEASQLDKKCMRCPQQASKKASKKTVCYNDEVLQVISKQMFKVLVSEV
eukprot:scaffold38060_cov19-Tisochrysis_lutea.AAC.1